MKTFLFILKIFWKAPTELVLVLRVRLLAPKSLAHFPRNSKPENSLFLHFDPCINRARSVHESQSSFLTLRNVARRLPFHFSKFLSSINPSFPNYVAYFDSLQLEALNLDFIDANEMYGLIGWNFSNIWKINML